MNNIFIINKKRKIEIIILSKIAIPYKVQTQEVLNIIAKTFNKISK
jgi:hypothetical protein